MKLLWNLAGLSLTIWIMRSLCKFIEPQSFGTSSGTIAFAGINLLGAIAAGILIMIGSRILKVEKIEDQKQDFVLLGLLIPIGLGVGFFYFGKWVLMLIGIVKEGGTPSDLYRWLLW